MGGNGRTLSVGELETSLSEVLDRVRDGECITIERDGETIAAIVPNEPPPDITVGEFLALLRELPRPDPGFADDLAEIQATQGVVEFHPWPN